MVHQRQRLPLGFEPRDDLLGVHTRLDHLESDFAPDRFNLLGDIDDAHATFAKLLHQSVAIDLSTYLYQSHRRGRIQIHGWL